jgi:hypothetical protein
MPTKPEFAFDPSLTSEIHTSEAYKSPGFTTPASGRPSNPGEPKLPPNLAFESHRMHVGVGACPCLVPMPANAGLGLPPLAPLTPILTGPGSPAPSPPASSGPPTVTTPPATPPVTPPATATVTAPTTTAAPTSATATTTTASTPSSNSGLLIMGGLAVVAGIAGIAYLAHARQAGPSAS